MQKDIGPIDLEEWVAENSDRVQNMREVALANQSANSDKRKADWDRKAQFRQFDKGDRVYMRKSGLNTKLEDSWAGPYTVLKKHSPLSYRVTMGDRVLPSVHIQLLKLYTPREPDQIVRRVISVLELDTNNDSMEDQYAEAKVTGKVDSDSREADIGRWESEFADTLTKEQGLTDLVQFKIETGLHPPICQGPYNTPQALLGSVDKELAWLKERGYIREINSNWAFPMVTVRDGSVMHRF